MSKLFFLKSLVILINSNDHEPAHVHVKDIGRKIHFRVFVADLRIDYISKTQLCSRDEKAVLEIIKRNKEFIMEKWYEIQKDQ